MVQKVLIPIPVKFYREFDFKISINPEGKHQEFFWSQEFPRAMEWLYYNTTEDPKELAKKAEIIRSETTEI